MIPKAGAWPNARNGWKADLRLWILMAAAGRKQKVCFLSGCERADLAPVAGNLPLPIS